MPAKRSAKKSAAADIRPYSRVVYDGVKQTPSRAMLRAVGYTRPGLQALAGRRRVDLEQPDAVQHAHRPARAGGREGRRRGRRQEHDFRDDHRLRRHLDGHARHAVLARLARGHRRLDRDDRRRAGLRWRGRDRRLRQEHAGLPDGARASRPAVGVRLRRHDPTWRRTARHRVGVRGGGRARAGCDLSDRELLEVERTVDPGSRQLRRHVHRQHDGFGHRGARHESRQQLGAGGRVEAQEGGCRGGGQDRRQADPAWHQAVAHPDARGVRERDRRDDRAGRLDQCRAAPAGDRARGTRAAGARRLLAHRRSRAGARGSAAERPVLDVRADTDRRHPAAHARAAERRAAAR